MSTNPQLLSTDSLHLGTLLNAYPELKIHQDDYNINVTSNTGNRLSKSQVEQSFLQHNGAGLRTHLYFHVPLCAYICHFCNYVKKKLPTDQDAQEKALTQWVDLLIEESNRYLARFPWISEAIIESVYFGGGTAASFHPEHLEKLMSHIRKNYKLSANAEITLEGNPDNFLDGLAADACSLGINRFSVGVQSLQNKVLKFVGRDHDDKMSIKAIEQLLKTGRPFNVDYMFGLPYQDTNTVENDMEKLISMGIPTITIYRLRNADRESMGIGNKAKWNNPKVRNKLHNDGYFPSLQETYEMREKIVNIFLRENYYPSPCGWWNKENVYPSGNIPQVSKNKWEQYDTMLAFGPGVYGWLTGNSQESIQTHNVLNISNYADILMNTDELPLAYGRHLTGFQSLATRLGFAFKANQPIVFDEYKNRFGVDISKQDNVAGKVINELIDQGFLSYVSNKTAVRPTLKGEALHEEIISVYIHQGIGSMVGENLCKKIL